MPSVRRGRVARLVLVGVLLLPCTGVARAATPCRVLAPDLGVDLARACATVRAAVPSWHGEAVVRLVDGEPGVAAETLGATVSVHREAWARLTPAGKQVVITHELVHVATDAFTTGRTPTWLVEGLADAVALRGIALPDRVVAQELSARVRRGVLATALPSHLPFDADFATAPALAYQESWLAVDVLLRRYGDAAVLRVYRAAGAEPLGEALTPLGSWTRSGTNGPDLVRPPRAITVPGLVAALRAEIGRRLS